jgi:RND superfamily putative drug exporter
MEQLVRDKGQITVPEGYPSTIANKIISEHNPKEQDSEAVVIVFNKEKGFTENQLSQVKQTVEQLNNQKSELGIVEITTHFDEIELKEQLVSDNNETILVLLDVKTVGKEVSVIREGLQQVIESDDFEAYMTGNLFISEDVIISSQNGLKKTEIITLVFILVVLVLVFRSVVAPIIPLVAVGITYITSQSIVAYLVEYFNFPLSNFTQIFLVAVLFGIGTDYCILLLSRFKEELTSQDDIQQAIIQTYKTSGKTVIYSGLAVLVGFASIGLATFKLYQSAAAVAIGVAVLLVALMTIVPFFMATLGKKLFWPIRGDISHPQSKLWGLAGHLSINRPFITLLIVAIIIVPLLIKHDGSLSFNSLDEIGDSYDSVKGFNIISDSFGPGESLPAKVVIENDESMKSSEYLTLIEKVSREIAKIDEVDKVRSATRPIGEEVNELFVSSQVDELKNGLSKGNDGISEIKEGLGTAASSLKDSKPEVDQAISGVGELVDGTNQLNDGVGELKNGLIQIESGLRDGTMGISQLKEGLANAKSEATKLSQGMAEMSVGITNSATSLTSLVGEYNNLEGGLLQAQSTLLALQDPLNQLKNDPDYTGLKEDPNFQTIEGGILGVNESLPELSMGMKTLNESLTLLTSELSKASKGMEQLSSGQIALVKGFDEFISGAGELEKGFAQAAAGQGEVILELPAVQRGLGELATGQIELKNGVSDLVSQLDTLESGLTASAEGLGEIEGGLLSATDYLGQLAEADDQEMSGFYIPEEVLKSEEFQKIFDVYISEDGKMTTLDIVLKVNPYSNEALYKIEDIRDAVTRAVDDTKLENAKLGISGVTSMYNDLQNISDADYSRTVIFMLVGIGIILIILLKSLIMPIYILASLVMTYFSSVAITELIFVNMLGYPGVNWAVPFFGFVILMALGVDYSIFLMDRFNEYREMKVEQAMMISMKNMGTVIMSAVVILAGTFAAMLPSGVLSLLQIATLVLSGLLLYALIVLPLFIPVMVKIFGRANWWPFYHHK